MMAETVLALALTLTTPPDDREPRPSRATVSRQIALASIPPPAWRSFAACVLDRESGGQLEDTSSGAGARNPSSSAAGRWQFLDAQWRNGLAFMVADRLVDHGVPRPQARRIRAELQATPIHRWPGRLQDVGFVAVITTPNGWRHWSLPGSRCQGLVP